MIPLVPLQASCHSQAGIHQNSEESTLKPITWLARLLGLALLFALPGSVFSVEPRLQLAAFQTSVTNISQLHRLCRDNHLTDCAIQIRAVLRWVSKEGDLAIVEDDTEAALLNIVPGSLSKEGAGQKILVNANILVGKGRISEPLVNNDGLHSAKQESGSTFLARGMHPIRVEWFNGPTESSLSVDWSGPELPRQALRSNSFFRVEADPQSSSFVHGLSFSEYEGVFKALPAFSSILPINKGKVNSLDLSVRTRPTNTALVFTGFIKVPRTGNYTFWLKSDDGSKLFLGDTALKFELLGPGSFPLPLQLNCGEAISEDKDSKWASVEGVVNFASEFAKNQDLEIISKTGRTQIRFLDRGYGSLSYLQGCQVKVEGLCEAGMSEKLQTSFSILAPSPDFLLIKAMPAENWLKFPLKSLKSVNPATMEGQTLLHVAGTVTSVDPDGFTVRDQTAEMRVISPQPAPAVEKEIEILGEVVANGTNTELRCLFYIENDPDHNNGLSPPIPLTQAGVIKRLTRAEAQQAHPVKLRGIITSVIETGFSIQDTTWSTYLSRDRAMTGDIPKVGDYCEVQGNTIMIFAPSVTAKNITRLGKGILPEPIQPRWDELMNGSLDTQYIQLEGYVVTVSSNIVHLLTRDGKIKLRLPDLQDKGLAALTGALISLRGVISPERDVSQQTVRGQLRLFNSSINLKAPPPAMPFEAPVKHAHEMLTFDVHANALQRLKIIGQVINSFQGEYYLMEQDSGLRFKTTTPVSLQSGDLVEVIGFPSMNGLFPSLHEAIVQVTGRAPLPEAHVIPEDGNLSSRWDSTLVRVKARVLSMSLDHSEQKLELQAGKRVFVARMERGKGVIPAITEDSVVEIQGTLLGVQSNQPFNNNIISFQLLLQSPSDVRVISRPSWWTPRRTITVIGSLGVIILLGMVWISLLHQQVTERTSRLAEEIRVRQKAEHQKALEEERIRIARDLHDDLGATLTQIRFLSALESAGQAVQEETREQLRQISEKSRQMVGSLDEIVWAVNPRNDSLRSLVAYLRHVAEELFAKTTIKCRLNIDKAVPDVSISSTVRHNLYLAVKEALNNCAKHSRATELWLHIHWKERELSILVEDNGCGFSESEVASENNGLLNMKQRLEQIGGRFEFETRQGSGTICRMSLYLA